MEIEVGTLLALPAARRLELAEILARSVGYPADIESGAMPAWRIALIGRLLKRYAAEDGDTSG